QLLRRCLRKEKDARRRDIGDARLELEELLTAPTPGREEPEAPSSRAIGARRRQSILKYAPWLVAAGMMGVALWSLLAPRPAAERPRVSLAIPLAPPESVGGLYSPAVAISPDGREVAYVATRGNRSQLYVRSLDRLEPRAILGTESAQTP